MGSLKSALLSVIGLWFLSGPVSADPWSDVFTTITATDELGTIGEQLVHEFYPATEPTGTINLLPKLDPTKSGPDRLVQLPDGTVRIHEIKTSRNGWPGRGVLTTEVKLNGVSVKVQQLDDQWIDAWAQRVRASGSGASLEDLNAVTEVLKARDQGRLVRIFDEIHGMDGKIRSSFVRPAADAGLVFEEKMGPLSLKRQLDKLAAYRRRFADLRSAQRLSGNVYGKPTGRPVSSAALNAKGIAAYGEVDDLSKVAGKRVFPGLLAADGKLWVGLHAGSIEGGLVFVLDAGVAGYRYANGDTLRADFLTEVSDAAIKGSAVGTATAVAVVLAPAGPAGWIVAGVGIGSYVFTDAALKTWHEHENRKYVTLDDLRGFGIDAKSVFEHGGSLVPPGGSLAPQGTLLPRRSILDPTYR